MRVCSRHFRGGDATSAPSLALGKRFASPKKRWTPRAKRTQQRDLVKQQLSFSKSPSPVPSQSTLEPQGESLSEREESPMIVSVGEVLSSDHQVHELYSETQDEKSADPSATDASLSFSTAAGPSNLDAQITINTALLARVEVLESENQQLKVKLQMLSSERRGFRVEDIAHDDNLVRLYTGFSSYVILLAFFEFLGPSVHELNYWGSKVGERKRNRPTKLNPLNQLCLTLMKLKLNSPVQDLAFRFMVSKSLVSKYVITWICFLYQHMKEIEWMPSVEQVTGTLPCSFRDKYPTTFAIIDGSEIFIETPSDLQLQSSTWSNYKQHNTAKFLVACTPNGAISYISPLYVGSISDVELTRHSGFLEKLEGRNGIAIMADRGFTIKDQLAKIGIELNIPPFMEGRQQLPAEEVQRGRTISSLRIHVERAIGRIKTFRILKDSFPISMARLANQIVCVCGWLTNFYPALVPAPDENTLEETDVDDYFHAFDSDTESSSASEDS